MKRVANGVVPDSPLQMKANEATRSNKYILDEVEDVISLPKFDSQSVQGQANFNSSKLSEEVSEQLKMYIQASE